MFTSGTGRLGVNSKSFLCVCVKHETIRYHKKRSCLKVLRVAVDIAFISFIKTVHDTFFFLHTHVHVGSHYYYLQSWEQKIQRRLSRTQAAAIALALRNVDVRNQSNGMERALYHLRIRKKENLLKMLIPRIPWLVVGPVPVDS